MLLVGGARSGKSRAGRAARVGVRRAGRLRRDRRGGRRRRWPTGSRATAPSGPPGGRRSRRRLGLRAAIEAAPADATLVVDCLSLWVANVLEADRAPPTSSGRRARRRRSRRRAARRSPSPTRSGWASFPRRRSAARYRDVLGRVNAIWAEAADEAYFVVAGRVLRADGARCLSSTRCSAAIAPPDEAARAAAQAALDAKTKPRGSLGRLEALAAQLAAIRARRCRRAAAAAIVVAAADHGVAAEGVSAYPQEVTAQMVANFAAGGAAINVLAREARRAARRRRRGRGGRRASSRACARCGSAAGRRTRRTARRCRASRRLPGSRPAPRSRRSWSRTASARSRSATWASATRPPRARSARACCRPSPAAVCGRGTGLDDERPRAQGRGRRAGARGERSPTPADPVGVLAAVGGFEIAVLAGVALGGAAERVPVVLDGFITGAAALVAARLAPDGGRRDGRVAPLAGAGARARPRRARARAAARPRPAPRRGQRRGARAAAAARARSRSSHDMASFADAGVTDAGR